jgi:rfaE bifunctional protein nucleotidyltransferase chain/domain
MARSRLAAAGSAQAHLTSGDPGATSGDPGAPHPPGPVPGRRAPGPISPGAPHPDPSVSGPPVGERSPSPVVGDPDVHSPRANPSLTGPPPTTDSPLDRALSLIAAVRAMGGTVVATGGCFDLLHAGHVATLRSARALGDCLVVCLNSDDSVRRLKGPERPLVPQADRVAVLEAFGCVDVVVPFDERTPEAVLQRLRPDVFAKGGDYALADLPEAALLSSWGGQAVVLPYLEGRSTTQLMKEVVRRDSH